MKLEEREGSDLVAEPLSLRIAIFTHDTFGLGHVRRCLHLIGALAQRSPQASILLITGSPALHVFDALPPNADYVKIPTIAKTGAKRFRPPHLPLPLPSVSMLRTRLIQEAILSFAPDVFLVDNFPLGSQGELLPVLHELRSRPTHTVLGLRDILEAPDVVRTDWTRQRTYEVLDRYYDRILVYGMREVLDIEKSYAIPSQIATKIHYCGYVTAPASPTRPAAEVQEQLGFTGPFLLATGGGGGDAFPLLDAFLQAVPLIADMPAVVFTGPLMSSSQRAKLRDRTNGRGQVLIRDYVPDLRPYVAAARAVVAMCGYNTATEIVALGARAVVVPRTWRYGEHLKQTAAGAEWEQKLRAQALARLGLVDLLEPETLTPERLAHHITAVLNRPAVEPEIPLDVGGLGRVTDHVLALASGNEEDIHVTP